MRFQFVLLPVLLLVLPPDHIPARGGTDRAALPNITAGAGIRVGRTFVRWGDTVTVKPRDMLSTSQKIVTVQFRYDYRNTGALATPAHFSNHLNSDAILVGAQSRLLLKAGETATAVFPGQLLKGKHRLTLVLDDHRDVAESNERDNSFWVVCVIP